MELRVVRVTDRFDEACRFWGELLGWPVTHGWDEPDRGRIFGYGDTARIELMEGTPEPVSGLFVSVEVDDVVATHDRLVADGIEVLQPVAEQPWGHRNVAVADPSGLRVVLFERL